MVQVENQTRNKMNTYYIKQDNGAFAEVTFSDGMLISMVIEKHIKDAIFNAHSLINSAIADKVNKLCDELNITGRIKEHLGTINMADVIDEQVASAISNYDYSDIIESATEGVDVDEMVSEAVQEYLSNTSIQVRIN
jgi:hypothetical protein